MLPFPPDESQAGEEKPEDHPEPQCGSPWEIDGEKWEQILYTTTIPLELPETGVEIAVKVIDQTGTELMTVIDEPSKVVQPTQA